MSDFLTSHRAIREALGSGSGDLLLVSGNTGSVTGLIRLAEEAGVRVERVSRRRLLAHEPQARDCALRLGQASASAGGSQAPTTIEALLSATTGKTALVLLLDHITDPHNYGAILRSADQFAVDAVIVPGRRSAPLSAVAMQASAGTAAHVAVITVANLAGAIAELQQGGFWVYAAEMGGEAVHRASLEGRTALVLGSEGGGVSRLVAERADAHVRIPMKGHADSLNVSVACGVLLYEVRRQQGWLDTV